MSATDFNAAKKWAKLPKNIREKLVGNVFCLTCGVTTIVNYNIYDDKFGILLKGKCKTCGNEVARLVEDE